MVEEAAEVPFAAIGVRLSLHQEVMPELICQPRRTQGLAMSRQPGGRTKGMRSRPSPLGRRRSDLSTSRGGDRVQRAVCLQFLGRCDHAGLSSGKFAQPSNATRGMTDVSGWSIKVLLVELGLVTV